MFKTFAYSAILAATAAGGHFAITLAQNFEAAQMHAYQSLATPAALAAPDYDQNASQVRAGLQSVAQDGQQWAAVQEQSQAQAQQ